MKTAIRGVMVLLLGLVPGSEARADSWVAPFLGVNFGGDAGGRFDDIARERQPLTFGLGMGGMGEGAVGVELDFAYSNRFFGKKSVLPTANHVMTIMPTLLVGAPKPRNSHGPRPYAEIGLGWLQRKLRVDGQDIYANENDWAVTLGVGMIGFVGDHIGIRGDYRYLRALSNDDVQRLPFDLNNRHFDFFRLSFGTVLRF